MAKAKHLNYVCEEKRVCSRRAPLPAEQPCAGDRTSRPSPPITIHARDLLRLAFACCVAQGSGLFFLHLVNEAAG